jgi:hypothetical protein
LNGKVCFDHWHKDATCKPFCPLPADSIVSYTDARMECHKSHRDVDFAKNDAIIWQIFSLFYLKLALIRWIKVLI